MMLVLNDGDASMHYDASPIITRPCTPTDAVLVYEVYTQTPEYFQNIAIEMPSQAEVEVELGAAALDPARHVEIILTNDENLKHTGIVDHQTGYSVIGYLDYKLNYPENCDATVNLLMISGKVQSRGLGQHVVIDLERRLKMQKSARRILASIYGSNRRAIHFWESLNYRFAVDAKPILDWYAKTI